MISWISVQKSGRGENFPPSSNRKEVVRTYIRCGSPRVSPEQRCTDDDRQPGQVGEERVGDKHHRTLPGKGHFPTQPPATPWASSPVLTLGLTITVSSSSRVEEPGRIILREELVEITLDPSLRCRLGVFWQVADEDESGDLLGGQEDAEDGLDERGKPKGRAQPMRIGHHVPGE